VCALRFLFYFFKFNVFYVYFTPKTVPAVNGTSMGNHILPVEWSCICECFISVHSR